MNYDDKGIGDSEIPRASAPTRRAASRPPAESKRGFNNAEGVREFQPSGWSVATTLGKPTTKIV